MNIRTVSKAIAGALATSIAGTGTAAIAIPEGIPVPWYGYVAVAAVNAAIGFVGVYVAPANHPAVK